VNEYAIRVEHLGKRYQLGERERYRALRDSLAQLATAPFRKRDAKSRETIWALRDINLEVQPGKVLGVIGHNGAGKSTLLKIPSRITEPSEGRAESTVVRACSKWARASPELTGPREHFPQRGDPGHEAHRDRPSL
jgi:lipopolysaccharide transport system ATP-binding protein